MGRRDFIFGALGVGEFGAQAVADIGINRHYFVDSNIGSDSFDGLSANRPWRSLARVSRQKYRPGDSVSLRSGQTHYVKDTIRLQPFDGKARGAFDPPVRLMAYGEIDAEMPKVSAWRLLTPDAWFEFEPGIWRADVVADSGAVDRKRLANIGRLLVDGELIGAKVQRLRDLILPLEFFSDGEQFLYLRCSGRPTGAIFFAPNIRILSLDFGVSVSDLWFEGTGGHAADVYSYTTIERCVFIGIGGSKFSDSARYGNGVQVFGGGSNVIAKDNLFWEIYDVALTCQGYDAAVMGGWRSIEFSDNWIGRSAQAFEIWAHCGRRQSDSYCGADVGFWDVFARRLRLFDIGCGSSRFYRWGYDWFACFMQSSTIEPDFQPIFVSVEEMRGCAAPIIFVTSADSQRRRRFDFVFERSNFSLPRDVPVCHGLPYTSTQWAEFVRETGVGIGSDIAPESALSDNFEGRVSFLDVFSEWKRVVRFKK